MKTVHDPRHLERVKVMQELFEWEFNKKDDLESEKSRSIIEKLPSIDQEIKKAAPSWPLEKINRIDLAILRQAVYELIVDKSIPAKVVVDEAVEIAKEYGSDASPSFINGALGKLISDNEISA